MTTFSIIGFGHIGRRHAEHILANDESQLVGICDSNPKQLETSPTSIPTFTDIKTLFKNAPADVVNICTPNYLHKQHAILAIESGSHVIIEKPMAMSSEECQAIIDCAEKHNKLIFAVKQNRYNPPVQIVKDVILKGQLGKIFKIQVNCFWNRNDAYYAQSEWRGKKSTDGGLLFTQFSHFIDILYYLIGNMDAISGVADNYMHLHNTEFEDTASFLLKSHNGAIIDFNCTTAAFNKNMEGSITIFAENGVIKIGGQYLNTIEYSDIKDTTLPVINITAKENDYGLYKGSMSNHDKVIQNTIDVLQHNGKIMTSAQEGKDVISIIEKMYKSLIKTS